MNKMPLPLFVVGLVALYLAERALSGVARYTLDGVGTLLLGAALALATMRWQRAVEQRRQAYGRVLAEYAVCAVGLLLYVIQMPELDLVGTGDAHVVLQIVWPTLVLIGLIPAVTMELAIAGMARTPALELRRVVLAGRAARVLGLSLVAFAGFNYAASKWNHKFDLSYFKTTKPGTSTAAIVEGLSSPVRFVLFYPPGNQVMEEARAYLDELAAGSPLATVEVVDQALDPELARKLAVRDNGYLAIEGNDRHQSLRIGMDVEQSSTRKTLRKLDAEVQKRLLEVARPPRVAYFTTGHLERDYAPAKDDKRLAMGDLKTLLTTLGYKVNRLGLGDGLGTAIPDDATLLVVCGPIEPFQPAERASIRRYLENGGSVLVAVDPDHGTPEDELLAMLGVKASRALVANSNPRFLVRVEGKGTSPYNLATNRTVSHPSVKTLQSNSGRLGVVLLGAGRLQKAADAPKDLKVTFTLRSMSQSWLDENGNGKRDRKAEKETNLDFAAAIEGTLVSPTSPKPDTGDASKTAATDDADTAGQPPQPDDGKEATASATADEATAEKDAEELAGPKPMRALVVADADVFGNGVMRVAGNKYFLLDGIRWLARDEDTAGTVESEEDVRIAHRQEEDTIWFYGTSFLIPMGVLVGGLSLTRRSGRRRRQG